MSGATQPLGNAYADKGYVEDGYVANPTETMTPSQGRDSTDHAQPADHESTYVTIDGERLTIGGNPITIGKPRMVPSETSDGAAVQSASWTGLSSPREKAHAVRMMVPTAMASIDTLIAHYEYLGDNGGPPLDVREALLASLRKLHEALGDLLDTAGDDKWEEYGEGLIVDAGRWLGRVKASMTNDPLPFAIAGLTEVIFGILGLPGAGIIATTALAGAKK